MAATRAGAPVVSSIPDLGNLPFDAEVNLDSTEYAAIMQRIGEPVGEWVTPVSAFNSSI
jgi:hypothetical protein